MSRTPAERERLAGVVGAFKASRHASDEALGAFDALTVDLIFRLDETCRTRLNEGAEFVFGNVRDLVEIFELRLREYASAFSLSEADFNDPAVREALFKSTLEELRERGDLVFATDRQRARSRAFEIVHYLRNLRQRTKKTEREGGEAPGLVEMLKVEVRRRERPVRTKTAEDLVEALEKLRWTGNDQLARFHDQPLDRRTLDELIEVFREFLDRAFGQDFFTAQFQVTSFGDLLGASVLKDGPAAFVIAAGTGFGKTEAFLFPILAYALYSSRFKHQFCESQKRKGVDALLLYPRTDLCDNQAERTLEYLFHLNAAALERGWFKDRSEQLRVALAHSNIDRTHRIRCPACTQERRDNPASWSEEDERTAFLEPEFDRYWPTHFVCRRRTDHADAANMLVPGIRTERDSADLGITTIDTLHRRLADEHGESKLFGRRLLPPRFVVVDEMHIYEGQSGSHAANIMRRCRQRVRRMGNGDVPPIFVGASATSGDPEQTARNMFGVGDARVAVIQPGDDEKKPQGLEYFLFIQSPGNRHVSASGDARDSRDNSEDSDGDAGEDSDEEAPSGAGSSPRKFVSERATMIQAAICLQHGMRTPSSGPAPKRRTLGFVDSIDGVQRLGAQLMGAEWQELLDSAPQKLTPPLYALRAPVGRPGVDVTQSVQRATSLFRPNGEVRLPVQGVGETCPKLSEQNCDQPPHHALERCERYESGECWFVSGQPNEEGLLPTALQTHRSGARAWGGQWPFQPDHRDKWRLLISTSALEVGFDHPEIISTWQYHAPPGLASFVQRKGRGGRGVRDFPITLMVLGDSNTDRFAFHHHLAYADPTGFPTYLDPHNPHVRTQHVFSAILDWCATQQDFRAIYKNRLDLLPQALDNTDARAWVQGCFNMQASKVNDILGGIRDHVQKEWLKPLTPGGEQLGVPPVTPFTLFREYDANRVGRWQQALEGRTDVPRTLAWLAAAAQHHADGAHCRSIFDFSRLVPNELVPDAELRIPWSTIAVPVGRHIGVYKRGGGGAAFQGEEPSEAALRWFLPGGFKIRYRGELWMAPWQPVPGKRIQGNITYAATRRQLRESPGAPIALSELLQRSDLDAQGREDVERIVGGCARVVYPRGVEVESLGKRANRRFVLDEQTLTVRPSKPDGAVGPHTTLSRDPSSSALRIEVPHDNGTWTDYPGAGPISRVKFFRHFLLTVGHYGNVVHCYPTEDGDTRSITVKFWDETVGAPLVVAARLKTQALELELGFPSPGEAWGREQKARAFWSQVRRGMFEQLVVQGGVVPNAYLVPRLAEVLQVFEAERVLEGGPTFWESPPTSVEIIAKIAQFTEGPDERDFPTLFTAAGVRLAEALAASAAWVGGPDAVARTTAETFAAAVVRGLGRRIGVSPASLRPLVRTAGGAYSVLIYDDVEGGSGNAQRLATEIERLGANLVLEAARGETWCLAAMLDGAVASALRAEMSPEARVALASERRIPVDLTGIEDTGQAEHVRARAQTALVRAFESSALAAFHVEAYAIYHDVRARLGYLPPHRVVLRKLRKTGFLDPRAEALRRQFANSGELSVRVRQVTPSCHGACPECLQLYRFGIDQSLDRELLAHMLNEGEPS